MITGTLLIFWSRKILISTITGRNYTYDLGPGYDLTALASAMAWVENTLNFTNGYNKVTGSEDDQCEYLVPFPPGYTSTTKAHWTTDVIVLDPSCNWQNATATRPVGSSWNVMLPKTNLGITLESDYLGMFLLFCDFFICLLDFSIMV